MQPPAPEPPMPELLIPELLIPELLIPELLMPEPPMPASPPAPELEAELEVGTSYVQAIPGAKIERHKPPRIHVVDRMGGVEHLIRLDANGFDRTPMGARPAEAVHHLYQSRNIPRLIAAHGALSSSTTRPFTSRTPRFAQSSSKFTGAGAARLF